MTATRDLMHRAIGKCCSRQVALTPDIASNIQQILELDTADTELHHQAAL